jgi:hypothetical protein
LCELLKFHSFPFLQFSVLLETFESHDSSVGIGTKLRAGRSGF